MNWVVFHIASGRAFFAAMVLLLTWVLTRTCGSPRLRRAGTWCLLLGLIALAVSATALPEWAYGLIGLSVAAPMLAKPPGRRASILAVAGASGLIAVGLDEARFHAMPVLRPVPVRRMASVVWAILEPALPSVSEPAEPNDAAAPP